MNTATTQNATRPGDNSQGPIIYVTPAAKRCTKCLTLKPLSEFHRNKASHDGHLTHCKSCACAVSRAYNKANPERQRAAMERWREAHPLAAAARLAVHKALRSGRLTRQPCESCGNPHTFAHHDDYAQPLNVRWLCRSHHKQHHASLGAQEVQP